MEDLLPPIPQEPEIRQTASLKVQLKQYKLHTFAVGSLDFIDLKAEKAAVPPPINR